MKVAGFAYPTLSETRKRNLPKQDPGIPTHGIRKRREECTARAQLRFTQGALNCGGRGLMELKRSISGDGEKGVGRGLTTFYILSKKALCILGEMPPYRGGDDKPVKGIPGAPRTTVSSEGGGLQKKKREGLRRRKRREGVGVVKFRGASDTKCSEVDLWGGGDLCILKGGMSRKKEYGRGFGGKGKEGDRSVLWRLGPGECLIILIKKMPES